SPRRDEALPLGLVVVVVPAARDDSTPRHGGMEPRQARLVDVDPHGAQPVARLTRPFAIVDKADDPALLHAAVVHAHAGALGELLPQKHGKPFHARLDHADAELQRIASSDAQADLAGRERLPVLEPARLT